MLQADARRECAVRTRMIGGLQHSPRTCSKAHCSAKIAFLPRSRSIPRSLNLSVVPASIRAVFRRPPFRFGPSMLLLVGMAMLASCHRSSDEEVIGDAISAMESSIEAARPADFMRFVAEDFTADSGALGREDLHNLLRLQVLRNARIEIRLVSSEIEVLESRATVTVVSVFTGGNAQWLPERGSSWRIVSGWRKRDGEWQCINAQWEQVF